MLIPTIYGTNTVDGAIVQPTATSTIWAFDLSEVSTIVGGTETKQLSLSDLGTDCPQSAEQSAIATMTDSRCDPILAAPDKIRAWASPCAACQRFGLFDPPYAIPTVTGVSSQLRWRSRHRRLRHLPRRLRRPPRRPPRRRLPRLLPRPLRASARSSPQARLA
ncbi:uncharacterized protein PG998_008061 [Apiospora kogelbergensis]|uniref:uncharacterized protein n=1 Tax=Apiospora kogelbergensis TaxID=1337665 RepID=UPI00312E6168